MATCRFPDENRPYFSRHSWLAALLLLIGIGLFALTTYSLVTHSLLFADDQLLSRQFTTIRKTLPGGMMGALTLLANGASILPNIVCLIFCYIWLRRKCDDRFVLILMSYGGGLLLFWFFALLFNRQRPDLPGLLKEFPFPSYPSGHMIQTITLLAPLLYLYLPGVRSRSWKALLLFLAVIYTVAIGLDRLITNAHYLTDVLGGAALALFWAVAVLVGIELYHLRQSRMDRSTRSLRSTSHGEPS
jgi:membrane-associated phospholipid phosphatase